MGISAECPEARDLIGFTYQKISSNVYHRLPPHVSAMFSPESFDYILGGLITINLTIEKTKADLARFNVNEQAFLDLFRQSDLQESIVEALDEIERQLTVSLEQMLGVVNHFDPALDVIGQKYNAVNYYTVNFDALFDHMIYGPNYKRGRVTTDFWDGYGSLRKDAQAQFSICHLHGDLRYKPNKRTRYNDPPYRWPVVVVGDSEVKKGIIGSEKALRFYNSRFRGSFSERGPWQDRTLAIIGFGFRHEDAHIVNAVEHALNNQVYDRVFLYSPENSLAHTPHRYTWVSPNQLGLRDFLQEL